MDNISLSKIMSLVEFELLTLLEHPLISFVLFGFTLIINKKTFMGQIKEFVEFTSNPIGLTL